ncbi:MAG: hypothetical protein ABSH53_13170 [Holophaga sp.]|jgi:hypothetical protein
MTSTLPRALMLVTLIAFAPSLPAAADGPSAEVKVGLGIDKMEIKDAADTFRAGDAGAWTVKVSTKDGKELVKADFTVEITKG